MKVVCTRQGDLPRVVPDGTLAFAFFERSANSSHGRIALDWPDKLRRKGYCPSTRVWDFVLLCLGAVAADFNCLRKSSPDGWTRTIELRIALNEPDVWAPQQAHIERMLRVLTGDFWHLELMGNGPNPPRGNPRLCDRDCVSLLSGGLDSLIGGIDLVAGARRPIFVSQHTTLDTDRQKTYARELGGGDWHQSWPKPIALEEQSHEPSTRGRSLVFFAQAVLASTLLGQSSAEIFVPENGFTSLNPPLNPGRVASLSTRTTHPAFMTMLQALLAAQGIGVTLNLPYQFKTKGEMLNKCAAPDLLRKWASDTTSCGRVTRKRAHCGRCVPCMVRRAAFLAWSPDADLTKYLYPDLSRSAKTGEPDDVMAAACAVVDYRTRGIARFLGAALSFTRGLERERYERVVVRGLDELGQLLARDGLI